MVKLVTQCDMEVMKMVMLKQEETFRKQVHELHRLYRIQTQLMAGDHSTRRQPRRHGSKQPRRELNLQLSADQYIVGADDEELELTLAIGGRTGTACKNKVSKRGEANYNSGGGCFWPPFWSDCSGGTGLLSSPPSSDEYSESAPGVSLHGYAPPPCQRATAFDLGVADVMKHQSPWQLVQC